MVCKKSLQRPCWACLDCLGAHALPLALHAGLHHPDDIYICDACNASQEEHLNLLLILDAHAERRAQRELHSDTGGQVQSAGTNLEALCRKALHKRFAYTSTDALIVYRSSWPPLMGPFSCAGATSGGRSGLKRGSLDHRRPDDRHRGEDGGYGGKHGNYGQQDDHHRAAAHQFDEHRAESPQSWSLNPG